MGTFQVIYKDELNTTIPLNKDTSLLWEHDVQCSPASKMNLNKFRTYKIYDFIS